MITNQSQKYHFEDFTLSNYRKLLRLAKQNYDFQNYVNFDTSTKYILWRHDIDFSMHRALKLAQLEAQENIKATYFVMFRSEFYNLMEAEISDLVFQIKNLGHDIGLHFDSHFYNIKTEEELEKYLMFEKELLEQLFQLQVHAFSFHNTTPFTMSCQNEKYAGLINVYANYFQTEVGYCSDSNGYWRFRRLEDVLQKAEDSCLQVLTHPSLWQDEPMAPRQRVLRGIQGRANKTIQWYDKTLAKYGRKNIDE